MSPASQLLMIFNARVLAYSTPVAAILRNATPKENVIAEALGLRPCQIAIKSNAESRGRPTHHMTAR